MWATFPPCLSLPWMCRAHGPALPATEGCVCTQSSCRSERVGPQAFPMHAVRSCTLARLPPAWRMEVSALRGDILRCVPCLTVTCCLWPCPQEEAAKEFQEKHQKEVGKLKDMDLSQ